MNKNFFIAFGAALVAAALLIALWRPPGRAEPSGRIGRVRAQKVDDNETIVIFDFNLRNDSGRPKTIQNISASMHGPDGAAIEGHFVGAAALANLFQNYPVLGEQFNAPLKGMDELKPGEAVDREVAVRFDAPDETISKRKDLVLNVEYINGPVVEMKVESTGR